MATILTVHGTFASGPEEGHAWWQRGSECCRHLEQLVEAEDGKLRIEPIVWTGLNSEQARQKAADGLLDRMEALDKAGERYCVVGHSHGGSVASAALLRAAFFKRPLDELSRWITIGTPFIEAKRSWLLFSRLGLGGKTAFLSLWAIVVGALVAIYFAPFKEFEYTTWSTNWIVPAFLVPILFAISYLSLWLLARKRLHWHDKHAQKAAREKFAARWLVLRHKDDEAVQGLGAFQSFRYPVFPRDFAVAPLSRLSIVVVPILVALTMWFFALFIVVSIKEDREKKTKPQAALVSAQSQTAAGTTQQPAAPAIGEPPPGQPKSSQPTTSPASAEPTASPETKETVAGPPSSNEGGFWGFGEKADFWEKVIVVGVVIAICVGIFLAIPIGAYLLLHLAARPASIALSYGLNRMTWSQLRRASLGSDVEGEMGRYARPAPIWLEISSRPLPNELAREITMVSDKAAAKSLSKFRAALSELSAYRLDQDGKDALNAFLSGDELIHTTYFRIPRFRKLLAYSIAQSPGFRPSFALLHDPDLPLIEQWYREVTASASQYTSGV